MCLEAWKHMHHIAVLAKHRVPIRKLLDGRKPEYIEPNLHVADDNKSSEQRKKREANNEKTKTKVLKEHNERMGERMERN